MLASALGSVPVPVDPALDGHHRARPAAAAAGPGAGGAAPDDRHDVAVAAGSCCCWPARRAARARGRAALDRRAAARSDRVRPGYPTSASTLVVANDGRAGVRGAWCATPGSPRPARPRNRHRLRLAPGDRALLVTTRCARRGAATCARSGSPCAPPGRSGLAARQRTRDVAGRGPVAAAVRVPQAPALAAGPAPRPRRPVGGPGARPGHRVRLAARVRPRRRRPLDRLAGDAPATATSWCAPGSPSATAGSCWCSTRRGPRPAGSTTYRGSTPRWTPRCCWPRSPPGPATGSTSWPATGGSAPGCGWPAHATVAATLQDAMADLQPVIAEADWATLAGAVHGAGPAAGARRAAHARWSRRRSRRACCRCCRR